MATYPDVAVVPLVVLSLVVAVVVPLAFYPFSYTLWAAVELKMRPLDPAETADAAAAVVDRFSRRSLIERLFEPTLVSFRDGPKLCDTPSLA